MKQLFTLLLCSFAGLLPAQNNYTQYVNPMVGTGGHGHTFPGATLPFGMVQLSPDTRIDGSWDGCSGYHHSDSIVYGFSHTHLSGTGCSDYGDISFMPTFSAFPVRTYVPSGNANIKYSHQTEKAIPGYYTLQLSNGILVELSATTRVGFQKYTYPSEGFSWITLNLNHRDKLLEGLITEIDEQTFSGFRRSRAWAEDQLVYFYSSISKKAEQIIVVRDSIGNYRMHLGYRVKSGESILIKTAISSVDEKGAKANMDAELAHWNFDKVKKDADKAWNTELNRIKAYGGTLKEKQNFYTSLYHCMIHPNIMNDVDGQYRGRDKKVHKAEGFNYYTVFSLWDTYRALHPLLNLIDKKRSHDFMMTFKVQYEQSGRLPMWELWGNETNCMIGFHSVSVIWNAYLRGVISRKELESLYPAVYAEAMSARSGLDKYRVKGFLSAEDESESVSKTLEYSFNMHCVSLIAACVGKEAESDTFNAYASAWRNVRNVQTGFMTPRVNGGWLTDFDPKQVNNHFTEANAWQYTFAVQHDLKSISNPYLLSKLFNTDSKTTGREQADITGLIGQYAHGNEPSHHFAYLFNNIDSSSKYVKQICDNFYQPVADGLCGNEDCGQMSAWYVFSAMGIYPADPSQARMVFGHMLFDSVRFNMGNTTAAIYRDSFGRRPLNYRKSNHIVFLGFANEYYYGYDVIKNYEEGLMKEPLLSAPVINGRSEVFRDSMLVSISSNNINTGGRIYYTLDGSDPTENSLLFKRGRTIRISQSCLLKAVEVSESGKYSPVAIAQFSRIDNNYSVQLNCEYNKQYTAGGSEGLVDGLKGDIDWRKGRWQGYQGQDFEAIIDLKKTMYFDTISIGFLEDRRSWIFLPSFVEVFGSFDGVTYESISAGDFTNSYSRDMTLSREPMEFTFELGYRCRYIKVVAKNFGKLPDWHPGAGGESFIFVDEIEIH
ncbi:MAG: GH92 family glycosyl hydrolase [Chitinophagaceae bacterium]